MNSLLYDASTNEKNKQVQPVILAAGRSSRFIYKTSKLLFPLCGTPLLKQIINTFKELHLSPLLVTGHQEETIKLMLHQDPFTATLQTVTQKEQCGTAHAVMQALPYISSEHTLVINGDMPLITQKALNDLIQTHLNSDADITLSIATTDKPFGYGRVITQDKTLYLQEEKNCSESEKLCRTINAGVYLFKTEVLKKYAPAVKPDEKTNEFFLPDIINTALKNEALIKTCRIPFEEIKGINTLAEACEAEKILQKRIINHWLTQGVYFQDPTTVRIDANCTLESYSIIGSGVQILNNSHIGSHVTIDPYTIVNHSLIGPYAHILPHSVIRNSHIETTATVGPFAHVHTNSIIGTSSTIGNFVEVKKSTLASSSKAKHLTYLGDSLIGSSVNIGAGTITCNYDGFKKHQTVIHDNASIGANNALVAPITIEQGAITAAGSTITESVPQDALAIARARQVNKEKYAAKRRAQKGTKQVEP